MQMNFNRKLPIPNEVKEEFRLTEQMINKKAEQLILDLADKL